MKHARPKPPRRWYGAAAVVAGTSVALVPFGSPVWASDGFSEGTSTTVSNPKLTKAQVAVQYAVSKISDAPYLWGGNGPTRFDCSGLTQQAWKSAGVDIPRTSQQQFDQLPGVAPISKIQPGDLVVYSFSSVADHVAMYVGPIGPNGEDLVDTATNHPNGGVGWSSMKTRGGALAGVVRPGGALSPAQGNSATVTPKPTTPTPKPSPTTQAPKPRTTPSPKPVVPDVKPEPKTNVKSGAKTGTHVVVKGDTLWDISGQIYGDPTEWPKLWEKNKDKIADPDLIFPGQELDL